MTLGRGLAMVRPRFRQGVEDGVNSEDRALFRQAMAGVEPLEPTPRVAVRRDGDSPLATAARREAAVAEQGRSSPLGGGEVPLLDAHYPLEFRRVGVQHGVFRKLKQGRYATEGRLDLHRMTVARAREEVYDFICEAARLDLRCLLIVHGRGSHSGSGPAVLKSHVNQWLPELESVQAFVSARPGDGGTGAVYVLLRKSPRARERNRLLFSRGRQAFP